MAKVEQKDYSRKPVAGSGPSRKLGGIREGPGLLDPGPFPFVLCAATGRTCGPGGRRLPSERPRPARTATPRCYRPTAAVPSSPPSEREPGLEREQGLEPGPGQPSAAGAQELERPSAARAHTEPWRLRHRPWRLCTHPYTPSRRWHHQPWPPWPWRRQRPPARPAPGRARRPTEPPPPPSPPASSASSI